MITRRNVLTGTAAVAAASVVGLPAVAGSEAIPTLWGDGEHDDTEALRWLFAGRTPGCPPSASYVAAITPSRIWLIGGQFRITGPVGIMYEEADWVLDMQGAQISFLLRSRVDPVVLTAGDWVETPGADVILNQSDEWFRLDDVAERDRIRHAFMRSEWARLRRG